MAPLTDSIPKPALPFLDKPIITYLLEQFREAGITRLVLALGHGADEIIQLFNANGNFGFDVHVCLEREPLGTGGALRNCLQYIEGRSSVQVANGDILNNINLQAMFEWHRRAGNVLTIAAFSVPDPSRYGLIIMDEEHRIKDFLEKPHGSDASQHWVNTGYYIIDPALVAEIPEGKKVSLERETFPALIRAGRAIGGFPHSGYWRDIGTLASFWRAHFEVLHHYQMYDPAFGGYENKGFHVFRGYVYIAETAVLAGKAKLNGQVVVSRGVKIGENAQLERTIVMPHAEIGEGAELLDCIIGPEAKIRPGEKLEGACITQSRKVPFDTGEY
ncbi:MAG: NDP-sugar synthase [bacterium]